MCTLAATTTGSRAMPEAQEPRRDSDEQESDKPHRQRGRRKPKPRGPPSDYMDRHELLATVPLSMSTIDELEKRRIFPSRFILEPTVKVAWKRGEVIKFMEQRAKRRVHGPAPAAIEPNSTST
jgi:predicted DNA-binding transcriptional regulator AlpA